MRDLKLDQNYRNLKWGCPLLDTCSSTWAASVAVTRTFLGGAPPRGEAPSNVDLVTAVYSPYPPPKMVAPSPALFSDSGDKSP